MDNNIPIKGTTQITPKFSPLKWGKEPSPANPKTGMIKMISLIIL